MWSILVSAPDPFHTCAEKGVEYTRGKGLANQVGVARAVGMRAWARRKPQFAIITLSYDVFRML